MALDAGAGVPEPAVVSVGCVLRMAPTMKNRIPMPIAEMNRDILRPRESAK